MSDTAVKALGNSQPAFNGAAVVMGVTSSGKTTVGEALAKALGARFIEGDKLHPPANVAKMSGGTPLTDEDRWPWLAAIGEALAAPGGAIAACSALKRAYRAKLAETARRPLCFVFLHGSRELLAQRIAGRRHHFMPPSLLASQLVTLEPPGTDERAIAIDIALPSEEIVKRATSFLTTGKG